ncbi:MAG TPA: methyltransferase domain-containing protein [Polyangiaceae bacterium]|nr:methyltransferase domain-containing protein [Polyangiaceae bacterium]
MLASSAELIGAALALLGRDGLRALTEAERREAARAARPSPAVLARVRAAIEQGDDPLGDAFCTLHAPGERRHLGATYTPRALVASMTEWAARRTPARVIDPGAGTGRFLVAAGRRFPKAELVAVELDPRAALLLRAHLRAAGLAGRATVVVSDYRDLRLPPASGPTVFLGNPPYVRHHGIEARWKQWLTETAARLGLAASRLSGLHAHFFAATALVARPGDYGAFVTAAEWLDVNYGALVRALFLEALGGTSLHVLEPTLRPFPDADTTAVVACFEVGSRASSVKLRRVAALDALGALSGGRPVRRERLAGAPRWTPLTRGRVARPAGLVELGELCRVHRGQVTGANAVWIAGPHAAALPPSVLYPTVTRARELFTASSALLDLTALRRVIDLPEDLDGFSRAERAAIERFLRVAREAGAHQGFIARHRRAWWSVGLREPAPILATYMARRPPAFVRNPRGARHLNIAHGLYPRVPLSAGALDALAAHLARSVALDQGRTYAGGLTKFEPREMERLLVPPPEAFERLASEPPSAATRQVRVAG